MNTLYYNELVISYIKNTESINNYMILIVI